MRRLLLVLMAARFCCLMKTFADCDAMALRAIGNKKMLKMMMKRYMVDAMGAKRVCLRRRSRRFRLREISMLRT